jgi:hypothetical protein
MCDSEDSAIFLPVVGESKRKIIVKPVISRIASRNQLLYVMKDKSLPGIIKIVFSAFSSLSLPNFELWTTEYLVHLSLNRAQFERTTAIYTDLQTNQLKLFNSTDEYNNGS